MKIKKWKNIILINLVICLTLLSGVISAYSVNKNFSKQNNEIYAETTQCKGDGTFCNDLYGSSGVYKIGCEQCLQKFSSAFWSNQNYSQKTIELVADLNMEGVDWEPIGLPNSATIVYDTHAFLGIFYGNGHTISNLTCNTNFEYFAHYEICGLFTYIAGETWSNNDPDYPETYTPGVYNLKFKDFTSIISESTGNFPFPLHGGAVAMRIGGKAKISNVEVSGFNIKQEGKGLFLDNSYIGGIVAEATKDDIYGSESIIENCYVEKFNCNGITLLSSQYFNAGIISGIGPSLKIGEPTVSVQNCVFKFDKTNCWNFTLGPGLSKNDDGNILLSDRLGEFPSKVITNKISILGSVGIYESGKGDNFDGDVCAPHLNNSYTKTPWFYNPAYNDGFPKLKLFINETKTIYIKVKDPETGSIDDENKLISYGDTKQPYGLSIDTGSYEENSQEFGKLRIGEYFIYANPKPPYTFKEWEITGNTYTAVFEKRKFQISFANARSDELGVEIEPTITTNINQTSDLIYYGETLHSEFSYDATYGYLEFTYTNVSGNEVAVLYTISREYTLVQQYPEETTIKTKTDIVPELKENDLTVKFKATTGVKLFEGNLNTVPGTTGVDSFTYDFKYNAQLYFSLNSDNTLIKFTEFQTSSGFNGVTFVVENGYSFDGAKIDNETIQDRTITKDVIYQLGDNAIISISTKTNVNVEFMQVEHSTMKVDGQQQTSAYNIEVLNGTEVKTKYNEINPKILSYEINNHVITYTADTYYAVTGYTNLTSVLNDCTISPIIEFYACTITMTKADDENVAIMKVGEEEKTEYSFIVEFGTGITVSETANVDGTTTYTYTFTSGKVVTYITTDEKYEIDKYGLDEGGTSTSYTFNNAEGKQKVISPTFKVKTYKLTVESNIGDELENYEIYHGSTLIYSANLSLSDNSKFELTYNCIYNQFAKKLYKETDYFLEYYKINDVVNYLDDFVIDNENIVVKSDISIKLAFTCFYTVEFIIPIEGVGSSTTLNSYTNPLSVRSGSEIKAEVPEYPNKELKYTLTTYDGENSITVDIFKYTLKQFYKVVDADNVDDLQGYTEITPIVELSACRVYIGEVDNLNIATINASGEDFESDYVFIVEFGTEVTFSVALQDKQINSTTEKVFVYTYTFSSGQVVTYTMANNDYAMSSVIENEERKWETSLGEDGKGTEDILEREEGTVLRICPTFEHKKYSGELA